MNSMNNGFEVIEKICRFENNEDDEVTLEHKGNQEFLDVQKKPNFFFRVIR